MPAADERQANELEGLGASVQKNVVRAPERFVETSESETAVKTWTVTPARETAGGTSPLIENLLVVAQNRTASEENAHKAAAQARAFLLCEGGPADEVAFGVVERHRPAEIGLERAHTGVHVLSGEIEAGLEPEGIARPETRGSGPRREEPAGEALESGGFHGDLEAVLTGVAGTSDEEVPLLGKSERAKPIPGAGKGPTKKGGRGGALESQKTEIVAAGDADRGRCVGTDPGLVLALRGGVHHEPVAVFAPTVGDEIVEDPSVLREETTVKRPAVALDPCHVVGEEATEKGCRAGPLEIENAHVRDVEKAGRPADLVVFLDLRAVVERHLVTAEIDETGAELAVKIIERRTFGHGARTPGAANVRTAPESGRGRGSRRLRRTSL